MGRQAAWLTALQSQLSTPPGGGWAASFAVATGWVDIQKLPELTQAKVWLYTDSVEPLGTAGSEHLERHIVAAVITAPLVGTGAVTESVAAALAEQITDRLGSADLAEPPARVDTIVAAPAAEQDLLRTPRVYVAMRMLDCEVRYGL